MKVAVVGAGIIGVTTAYELSADGHEVSVFERRGSVAAETSFANAGLIAPGYVTPWAAPGMPAKVLKLMMSRHAPVRLRGLHADTLPWMWQWWRACQLSTYQSNRLRMQRLAVFSRERLHSLTTDLKLDYERSDGYLVLLRSDDDLRLARPGLSSLAELGTRFKMLSAEQCRAVEPNLSPETELRAGIHLPDDEVGNCRQFSHLLVREAQRLGARFRFNTEVQRIIRGPLPQLVHEYAPPHAHSTLSTTSENALNDAQDTQPTMQQAVTEGFDAVVVCAALESVGLLRPLGLKLPLQAVHGYSITAPLRDADAHGGHGPRSALMDERYKVAISRLGSRVRVAGSAEIGGSATTYHKSSLATLYKVLHDWFPGSARMSQAQRWKGARPMLPDGPPVLGRSGIDGVWLNLGHGSSGWALSCGSARLLADAIVGRPARIDTDGLGVERLSG
ncbi:MAG: FAD-dependent oxidoreductase [Burkholderiales bacterium]